jgi:hypothetical protein
MNRAWQLTTSIILGAFVIGFCVGLCVDRLERARPSCENLAPPPAHEATAILDGAGADSLLPARARQLQADLDAEKKKEADLLLQDHLELFKKYRLSPSGWGEDLKITDEMADFLKMSPDERRKVDALLAQTFAENRLLQAQHLKLISQKDNVVTYQISMYREGHILRDEFQREMQDALGADRAAVLVKDRSWEIQQSFSDFGDDNTQIEITRIDQTGPPRYRIMEAFPSGSSTTISDQLPHHLSGLLQLDPTP